MASKRETELMAQIAELQAKVLAKAGPLAVEVGEYKGQPTIKITGPFYKRVGLKFVANVIVYGDELQKLCTPLAARVAEVRKALKA